MIQIENLIMWDENTQRPIAQVETNINVNTEYDQNTNLIAQSNSEDDDDMVDEPMSLM